MKAGSILVTGADGFIGRRMLSELRARGYRTIGLSRVPSTAAGSTFADQADWIVADIASDQAIELPAGIDAIIHLAGKAHALAEVVQDDAEYSRINTGGTRRMLESARRAGVRAFVFFSTVKAVGDRPNAMATGPADESWDASPTLPMVNPSVRRSGLSWMEAMCRTL